jgi:hypothetical protein
MSHRLAFAASLALGLVAGCSGNKPAAGGADLSFPLPDGAVGSSNDGGSGNDDMPASSTGCALTLSGGVTASLSCNIQGLWTMAENLGGVSLSGGESSPTATVAINRTGELVTGTFTQADSGAQSSLIVSDGLSSWSASVGAASADQGSYSLALTKVTVSVTAAGGKGYLVSGTLDATLPVVAGSQTSTAVTLHATFSQ